MPLPELERPRETHATHTAHPSTVAVHEMATQPGVESTLSVLRLRPGTALLTAVGIVLLGRNCSGTPDILSVIQYSELIVAVEAVFLVLILYTTTKILVLISVRRPIGPPSLTTARAHRPFCHLRTACPSPYLNKHICITMAPLQHPIA